MDDLVTSLAEDASYGAAFNPNTNVYQWDAFDPNSPNFGKATPWTAGKNDPSSFFNTPVSNVNSIFLDGGGENGQFKLGYTRNDEKGLLPNSSLNKDFVNFGASYKISDKLTASAAINFTSTRGKGRYSTGYSPDASNILTNFRQWWQINVDVLDLRNAYERNGGRNITWNPASVTNQKPIYWDNPYFIRFQNFQNDSRNRYFGNTQLDYKVNSWLTLMGRASLDGYDELQEERIAVGSLVPAKYTRFSRTFREFNYDLMATATKQWGKTFSLTAIVGSNNRRTTTQSIFNSTNNGLAVPGFYALTNSKDPMEPAIERFSDLQVNGIYASTTLGYKKMLFLDLALRGDQASSLPVANNIYYYPSVSTSFVFSDLFPKYEWFTNGKFRANYAEVGNTAPTSSLTDVYNKATPFGSVPLFSVNTVKNNSDLRPERTKSIEVGLEASFFDGRFGFDMSYYKQNTVNQILPASVSRATGQDTKFINAGNVLNQGIELSVFVTPVKTKDFSWTINANWTRNRNKVIELAPGVDNLQLGAFQGGVTLNAAIGEAFGTLRGENFVYNDKGQKVIGSNGYYERSATSNEIIGNVNPDWIGGVSNTLKYKNMTFSFLIDAKSGGNVFSLDMYYGLATGLYPETAGLNDKGNPSRNTIANGGGVVLDGVKGDGSPNDIRVSNTNFGVFGYRRTPPAGFVYDASFVKLRELSLSYSLPKSMVEKMGVIKGVDISITGRNLWIIYKNLPYADPEDQLSSGNLSGFQVGSMPNTKNIGFNLKLKL